MLNVEPVLEPSLDEPFSSTLPLFGVALYISKNENPVATSVTVDEEASTLKKPIEPAGMAFKISPLVQGYAKFSCEMSVKIFRAICAPVAVSYRQRPA